MANFISALNGKAYVGEVKVSDLGLRGMITLRGDLTSSKLRRAASNVAGVTFPKQGDCIIDKTRGLAWMSPDEVLVMVPHDDVQDALASIEKALKGTHFLAVNVSDARTIIRLEGAGIRDVLAKLAPVDLSHDAFQPGRIRRTRLAQVPAAFWMRDETTLDLVCFRSVADYAFDVLCRAAIPGTAVGHLTAT